ncbi:hypothetical protein [Pararhizobium sp.]|uniref:hypothetical protein n=1 Tax=Pararhizobium sp. TaxID=1977563 RepID=UPI002723BAA2|nr:hypothetical protein [Pararhizobium sp.]MDO9417825.1 hypothetical protein [Pararhizobium sp.]
MKSKLLAGALATILITMAAQIASAEERQFYCGEESFLAVDIIDAKRISAGLINGETLILKKIADTNRYSSGKTTIELSADENTVMITPEGGETIGCVFPVPKDVITPGGATANVSGEKAPGAKTGTQVQASDMTAAEQALIEERFEARSYGGVVRGGPGMEFPKVASLKENEPITVIRSTGVEFNGYMWFEIRFRHESGFHWGGIICPIGKEQPGAFGKCD